MRDTVVFNDCFGGELCIWDIVDSRQPIEWLASRLAYMHRSTAPYFDDDDAVSCDPIRVHVQILD